MDMNPLGHDDSEKFEGVSVMFAEAVLMFILAVRVPFGASILMPEPGLKLNALKTCIVPLRIVVLSFMRLALLT